MGQEAKSLETCPIPGHGSIQTYANFLVIAEVLNFKVIEVPLRDAKSRAGEPGQAAQVLQLIPRGLATYTAAWNKGAGVSHYWAA